MCNFMCRLFAVIMDGIQVPLPSCHPSRALEADAGGIVKHRVSEKTWVGHSKSDACLLKVSQI